MTAWFVRSGASGTNDGSSWANAFTNLQSAIFNHGVGGDTFWLADDHDELNGSSGALEFNVAAGYAAPYKVFCVDHTKASPSVPGDLKTTAKFTTTGAVGISFAAPGTGIVAYWYGVNFIVGGNGSSSAVQIAFGTATNNTIMWFENCSFKCATSNATTSSGFKDGVNGGSGPSKFTFRSCTFEIVSASQTWSFGDCIMRWENCQWIGAVLPTTAFTPGILNSNDGNKQMDGCDWSLISGTLIGAISQGQRFNLTNCRLNASVTPAATPTSDGEVNLISSDSSTKSYRQECYRKQGTLTTETTIVRTGGASDSVTPISHKVVTTANNGGANPFEVFEYAIWHDIGAASPAPQVTLTLELVTDNVVLKDNDIWMDVEYLGDGVPQSSLISSASNIGATGSNLTTSTATWTTTGLGTPKKQNMSVSFTPQISGLIRVKVRIAKASTTIYLDPFLTVA